MCLPGRGRDGWLGTSPFLLALRQEVHDVQKRIPNGLVVFPFSLWDKAAVVGVVCACFADRAGSALEEKGRYAVKQFTARPADRLAKVVFGIVHGDPFRGPSASPLHNPGNTAVRDAHKDDAQCGVPGIGVYRRCHYS